MEKPDRYTDAQWKIIQEAMEAEQAMEIRAAFGEGVKVVNVITGKKFTS